VQHVEREPTCVRGERLGRQQQEHADAEDRQGLGLPVPDDHVDGELRDQRRQQHDELQQQ
jgi:hypothetical protein